LGQGARKVNLPKNALDRNPRGARGSTVPDLDRKRHYSQPETVEFYTTAAVEVGLWRSEEALFRRVFAPGEILLNVGCGAGRVSLARIPDIILLRTSGGTMSAMSDGEKPIGFQSSPPSSSIGRPALRAP
jgi:hypothetical protein